MVRYLNSYIKIYLSLIYNFEGSLQFSYKLKTNIFINKTIKKNYCSRKNNR